MYVSDAECVCKQAVEGGATAVQQLTSVESGDLHCMMKDAFGYTWEFIQPFRVEMDHVYGLV